MRATYFGTYDFNADGVVVIETTAPRKFASGLIAIPGANGALDSFGSGQSPKQPTQVTVRFEVRQTSTLNIDQQLAAFMQAASTGLQWLKFLLADGTTTYRALAKCIDAQPAFSRRTLVVLPITATFELAEPYWYADTQTTNTFNVSATPTAIDLTNAGSAPLIKAILRFTGTANLPKFLNNTNGFYVEVNQNITSSKVVEIDLGAQTITVDAVDAWADKVIPATQIDLFRWEVGANDVDFVAAGGGTPSGTVEIIFREMYH